MQHTIAMRGAVADHVILSYTKIKLYTKCRSGSL